MKFLKTPIMLLVVALLTISCFEDNDDNTISANQINDFVWKGMNIFYLYKDNVPDLANDRFSSDSEYADYLNGFSSPETLFESVIYNRETVDKYSWIVDDYIALEQYFSGVSTSNGMEFSLFLHPNNNSKVFGVVRLVLNNSDADNKGLKRGDIFDAINNTPLTTSNYNSLLSEDSYTLNLAMYDTNNTPESTDDNIVSTSEAVSLTKLEYAENPIFKTNIFDVGGEKVGYLMYNGFTADYDSQLNNVFADFKANNIQHLVLDLRYNPGGSVNSAILLSSMITGQFTGDIFSTEQWNSEFQQAIENEDPELLINRFTNNDEGAALNSLNLSKVYIIATEDSASASELVINSLDPYINVVHIGENTTGKYQASTTLYDSEDYGREGANPNHTYAMQPLIFKSLNKVGYTDYIDGLTPDIELHENYLDLGIIGNENETLLAAALNDILNATGKTFANSKTNNSLQLFEIDQQSSPFENDMYIEKELPENILNQLIFD
ncbi:S41 family peptidase [Aestuariivivens insulae]|uniref:S41 family peptidase n=1 Tax=Aestuariivivens insulae TaxID=1621988 RepID=UPI001F5A1EC8|nr:S41 family peptidase [Aestuariivivens insulae]